MVNTSYQDTGLDWSTDSFTDEEYRAMAEWYEKVHGEGNLDLCQFVPFMMDLRPDALKKYRHWVEYVPPGKGLTDPIGPSTVLVWLHFYGTNGYRDGFLYEAIAARDRGATKAEVAQTTVWSWLHGGPFGLNSAAGAALDYMQRWQETDGQSRMEYPVGWAPDPDAFRSGMNLDPDEPMTEEDAERLADWHRRVQGSVPAYVRVLSRVNAPALKVWRARYENAGQGPLPKQLIALLQVHAAMMMREPASVRRAVHMARHFGATRGQTIQVLSTPHVYLGDLGMEAIAGAEDLLDDWPAG